MSRVQVPEPRSAANATDPKPDPAPAAKVMRRDPPPADLTAGRAAEARRITERAAARKEV